MLMMVHDFELLMVLSGDCPGTDRGHGQTESGTDAFSVKPLPWPHAD